MDNDNDSDLATGLFSPSKARLAQVQAKDWAYVDAWLAKKYAAGRIPGFERNDDTLSALLTLITRNENADEQHSVTHRVQRLALQCLNKQHAASNQQLRKAYITALSQDTVVSLQRLAETVVVLECPVKDGIGTSVAQVIQLMNDTSDARAEECRARHRSEALEAEHVRLLALLATLEYERRRSSAGTGEQTTEWIRGAKHLRGKVAEYDERLASSRPSDRVQNILDELVGLIHSSTDKQDRLLMAQAQVEVLEGCREKAEDAERTIIEAKMHLARLRAEKALLVR